MTSAIRVINVSKNYPLSRGWMWWKRPGSTPAIRNLNLNVRQGEVFGLLGPNGAGKSTLINMLNGIITPDKGIIEILGEPFSGAESRIKQRMNLVAGHTKLNGWLSVYENLRVFAEIYNVKNPKERISHVLKRFGLFDIKDQPFHNCSSGQQIRTLVAKGLLNSPELLLLEEPTMGLDPDVAETVRAELLEEHQRTGMTILLTSHYMPEAEELCDRIAMLKKGQIFRVATPQELRAMIRRKRVEFWFHSGTATAVLILKKLQIRIVIKEDARITIDVPTAFSLDSVLPTFLKQGVRISAIHTHDPDLEDVFITIARGAPSKQSTKKLLPHVKNK